MSETTSETRDAERFLQLAAAAETVANVWRQRAAALLRLTSTDHGHAHGVSAPADASHADEPDDLPPDAAPSNRPGRRTSEQIVAVVKLCLRKNGASGEELMLAAGWPRPPYPSSISAIAQRRGLTVRELNVDGERRWRFLP